MDFDDDSYGYGDNTDAFPNNGICEDQRIVGDSSTPSRKVPRGNDCSDCGGRCCSGTDGDLCGGFEADATDESCACFGLQNGDPVPTGTISPSPPPPSPPPPLPPPPSPPPPCVLIEHSKYTDVPIYGLSECDPQDPDATNCIVLYQEGIHAIDGNLATFYTHKYDTSTGKYTFSINGDYTICNIKLFSSPGFEAYTSGDLTIDINGIEGGSMNLAGTQTIYDVDMGNAQYTQDQDIFLEVLPTTLLSGDYWLLISDIEVYGFGIPSTCNTIVNDVNNPVYVYGGDPSPANIQVLGIGDNVFDNVNSAATSYTHEFPSTSNGLFQMSLTSDFELCKAEITMPEPSTWGSYMVGELKIEIDDGSGSWLLFDSVQTTGDVTTPSYIFFPATTFSYVANTAIRVTLTPPSNSNTDLKYLIISQVVFSEDTASARRQRRKLSTVDCGMVAGRTAVHTVSSLSCFKINRPACDPLTDSFCSLACEDYLIELSRDGASNDWSDDPNMYAFCVTVPEPMATSINKNCQASNKLI